jgi:O-antigen/teichoic acid export membrane protein
VSAVVKVALAVVLLKVFGLTGVAIATLVVNLLVFVPLTLFCWRTLGGRSFRFLLPSVGAALVPALVAAPVAYGAAAVVDATSLLGVVAVGMLGSAVYLAGYLRLPASSLERRAAITALAGVRRRGVARR